jgi:quinol monooxygenase YgiN
MEGLNRKETEDYIIDLFYNQNKTFREIQKIVRMSPLDIRAILDKLEPERASLSESSEACKECNYYDLYKSERPRSYLVMGQYKNRNALRQHQKSEHGKYYFPKNRELLESIEVSYFECVVLLESI